MATSYADKILTHVDFIMPGSFFIASDLSKEWSQLKSIFRLKVGRALGYRLDKRKDIIRCGKDEKGRQIYKRVK